MSSIFLALLSLAQKASNVTMASMYCVISASIMQAIHVPIPASMPMMNVMLTLFIPLPSFLPLPVCDADTRAPYQSHI